MLFFLQVILHSLFIYLLIFLDCNKKKDILQALDTIFKQNFLLFPPLLPWLFLFPQFFFYSSMRSYMFLDEWDKILPIQEALPLCHQLLLSYPANILVSQSSMIPFAHCSHLEWDHRFPIVLLVQSLSLQVSVTGKQ